MAGAGAAVVVEDSELDGDRVRSLASELILDDARLSEMGNASAGLAMPDAAERVADEILATVGGQG
jgi:UDP-N-acetylglucosamine:LPS N-acetylglucosamine transferase